MAWLDWQLKTQRKPGNHWSPCWTCSEESIKPLFRKLAHSQAESFPGSQNIIATYCTNFYRISQKCDSLHLKHFDFTESQQGTPQSGPTPATIPDSPSSVSQNKTASSHDSRTSKTMRPGHGEVKDASAYYHLAT